MRTTLIGRWLEKNNKPFVALLAAGATLAIAMLVDASSSPQVEQLGQMAIHRSAHKATALSDGRVLITGGRNTAGIVIADAEIFDPNTGESSAVAPMATARVDHTATLLKDGRVLITGGSNATGTLNSAEIFDPSTGTFSAVSGSMNMARARHTATLLGSGKVLIAGGDVTPTLVDPNGTDVTGTAEMFDPTAGTFGDLVLLQRSRSGHTATLFSNDTVWLAGGGDNTIESFNASAGAFTLSDTTMTAMRSGHEAFALSDTRLLLFGGDTDNTIDEFNPSADTLTLKATMNGAASSATLLANGKVLVLRSDAAGLYAPDATDQATAFSAFDETSVPDSTTLKRSGQTATELSGDKKILVAGGENAQQQPMLQIAAFNPARIWTDKDDYMPTDPVLLFGSGWKPNEDVYLYAVDSETEQWTYGSTATADAQGSFAVQPLFIVEMRHLGTTFNVSAVGAQSNMQADVEFTDNINFQSVTVGPQSGTATIGTGASVMYQVTANYSGNGNIIGDPVTLTFVSWTGTAPAGVTTSFSTTSVSNASPTSILTITTLGTTPAGTYTFTVQGKNAAGTTKTDTGTLTVNKQSATVTLGSLTQTYDGTPKSATATTNPTGLTVNITYNGSSTPPTNAGSYAVVATINDPTYAGTASGTLVISKATPTVTVSGGPFTYDGTQHAATATAVGVDGHTAVSGTFAFTYTPPGNATVPTNAGNYSVSAAFTSTNTNYSNTTGTGSITITRATPAFSNVTASQTINQGTATISLAGRLNAGQGFVPTGTATITVDGAPVATSSTFNGAQGSFTATVDTHAIAPGTFPITYSYAGDTNYSSTSNNLTNLTVIAATTSTVVTSSKNPSTYGDSVTFTATVTGALTPTGSVNFVIDGGSPIAGTAGSTNSTSATWTYTTSALTVATHSVSASFVHTGSFQDSSGSLTGGQTVNKKTLTASIVGDPTKPYDGNTTATLISANFSLTGLVGTDNFTVTQTSGTYNSKDVTTANIVTAMLSAVDFTPTGGALASNYVLPTTASGPGHINAKNASVTADNKDKDYGDNNPALTATVVGEAASGDAINYTLATTALKFSNVGDYAITVTLGSNPNYNVIKTDGNLHINAKNASVTADNKGKTYGDDNPTFSATVVGEVVGGDAINYTLATTALKFSNVGDYAITVTLGSNPNYNVIKTDGNLHINAKDASVTADNKGKTYGDDNPTFSATVVGEVVGGDAINYTLATTALKFSNVGDYAITVTLGSNPNYNVTKTDGNLHISPKDASVTADNKGKTYGDDNPTFSATVVGEVVGGDAINYTLATTALKFSNVGDYAITVTLGSNPNYNVTKTDGNLHISPKDASVTADNKGKTYGDDNPAFSATVVGQVSGGDTINYTLATTALKFSNAGDYPITVTLGSNPNYNVTKTDGNLHISPKDASVTADNKGKIYGDDNPALTATVVGQVVGGTSINYTLATTALKLSGVGDYAITVTLGTNPNYNVTKTDGTLHISPKDASVTADNKSKTYGNDNPAFSATVVGQVSGGDTISYTLATTALKFSNAGDYPITVTLGSNPNYNVTPHNGTLTVNQATQTISWSDPAAITLGTPLSAAQLNATVAGVAGGSAPGALTYTPPTGTVLGVGANQALRVDAAATINYNAATMTVHINVNYTFVGFLQPIDNLPIVNSVKAGQTIPVKWQLKDAAGNLISDPGSLAASNGLTSVRINCDGTATTDLIEELAAPGSTVFRFDGTQFIYNWQTTKSWAGTCRMMTVTLKDGKVYTAQFTFK